MLSRQASVWSAFRPVFLLSKAFGTLPLSLTLEPHPFMSQSTTSLLYSCLCVIVVAVHAVATPWFVTGDSKTASTLVTVSLPTGNGSKSLLANQTSVRVVALRLMNPLIVSFMSFGAQVVVILVIRPRLPRFFSDLAQVDTFLRAVIRSSSSRDAAVSRNIVIFFSAMSIPVTSFYLVHSLCLVYGWEFIWNFILTLGNVLSFMVELQFMNLAFFIHARFRIINTYLSEHSDENTTKVFTLIKKDGLSCGKIRVLRTSYQSLLRLVKELNSIYQVQILLSLSGSFIKILFNLYSLISSEYDELWPALFQLFKVSLWTYYYMFRFIAVVITATSTSKEGNNTSRVVASLNSRACLADVRDELDCFLSEASTQKISFTACGLFTVNTKLIMSAVGTGTTYLVVLVQFRPQI